MCKTKSFCILVTNTLLAADSNHWGGEQQCSPSQRQITSEISYYRAGAHLAFWS